MKLAAVALSLTLGPLALCGQTAPMTLTTSDAVAHTMPYSHASSCPVSLQAQQISSANMMQVRRGQPEQSGQRLHLTFTSRDAKQIAAATIAVRGFTPPPGPIDTLKAVRKRNAGPDVVTRTVQIAFAPQAGATVNADILVPDLTATQTIDLVSLSYADGTGWKLPEGASCRITPDLLMLVGAH